MNRGYIKLWRKVCFNGLQKDHKTFTLWIYILCNVTHKECDVILNGQRIHLMPGEMITGRKHLAKDLRVSEQSVRTCLHRLQTIENLTIKSTNKFSIISVTNWDRYQLQDYEINHQINQSLTSNQPAPNHIQECKEYKNKEKISSRKSSSNGKCKIPSDFCITDKMTEWFAEQNFQHITIEQATENFIDYWAGEGKMKADWVATWRNGMKLAEKWAKKERGVDESWMLTEE